MTMNMTIVMTMNIYINVENTKLLAKESNKSGLINMLLTEHFSKTKVRLVSGFVPDPNTHKINIPRVDSYSSDTKNIRLAEPKDWKEAGKLKPACCLIEGKLCKHWVWDMDKGTNINSITGEVKE